MNLHTLSLSTPMHPPCWEAQYFIRALKAPLIASTIMFSPVSFLHWSAPHAIAPNVTSFVLSKNMYLRVTNLAQRNISNNGVLCHRREKIWDFVNILQIPFTSPAPLIHTLLLSRKVGLILITTGCCACDSKRRQMEWRMFPHFNENGADLKDQG